MSETRWQAGPAGLCGPLAVALIAVVLGGCSEDGGDGGVLSQAVLDEAARSIVQADAPLTPAELSDTLIGGRDPVDVVDLRPPESFNAGHIKGARNIALAELLSADGRAHLGASGMPVLVSEDGTRAAQAVALLRLAGADARVLAGGHAAWTRYLNRDAPGADASGDSAAELARRQAAACWFEGDYLAEAGLVPKRAAAAAAPAGFVPPLQPVEPAPAAPADDPLGLGLGLGLGPPGSQAPAAKPKRKLKVREGC